MIDRNTFANKRVAFHTLGCKLNFSETSAIARQMTEAGFTRVDFDDEADVYVINTCSVTDFADKKCRQMIKRCIRRNGQAFIVVTGCYAQLEPREVAAIEGVDLVLGSNEKADLMSYLDSIEKKRQPQIVAGNIMKDRRFTPSFSSGDRTRSFLKIQDGCDYFCSYCTIPFARGTSRSDTVEATVDQARQAAEHGAREIILTGVNIGDFGRRNGQTFIELLRRLDTVEGVSRYRISSIEPNLLTDEIIDFVAASRTFMPHFHVPLQSGSNEVLRLMRRRYDAEFFARKIERIRTTLPDAFVGIDVIVGVNGETERHFDESKRLLESIDFSQLHVFTYSERPGTRALDIAGTVPMEERHRRSRILHALSDERRLAFYRRFVGRDARVLVESSERDGYMTGFTDNYLKVEMPYCEALANTLQTVRLRSLTPDRQMMVGTILTTENTQ